MEDTPLLNLALLANLERIKCSFELWICSQTEEQFKINFTVFKKDFIDLKESLLKINDERLKLEIMNHFKPCFIEQQNEINLLSKCCLAGDLEMFQFIKSNNLTNGDFKRAQIQFLLLRVIDLKRDPHQFEKNKPVYKEYMDFAYELLNYVEIDLIFQPYDMGCTPFFLMLIIDDVKMIKLVFEKFQMKYPEIKNSIQSCDGFSRIVSLQNDISGGANNVIFEKGTEYCKIAKRYCRPSSNTLLNKFRKMVS